MLQEMTMSFASKFFKFILRKTIRSDSTRPVPSMKIPPFQETEKILKRESKVSPLADSSALDRELDGDMAIYRSEGDPDAYEGVYDSLRNFVETALDSYRHELSVILYPCFVHMYLELVYNNHLRQAEAFMERFVVFSS